jgi:hypothetical protein
MSDRLLGLDSEDVAFVLLIGKQGWQNEGSAA